MKAHFRPPRDAESRLCFLTDHMNVKIAAFTHQAIKQRSSLNYIFEHPLRRPTNHNLSDAF